MLLRAQRSFLLICCLCLLLCSSCSFTSGSSTAIAPRPAVTINVYDNYFDPSTIHVTPQQDVVVTFVNKGTNIHIVEILGLVPETTIQPGARVQFTVSAQARAYKLYDELYVGAGMIGTYTGEPGAASTGAAGVSATPTSVSQATMLKNAIEVYHNFLFDQTNRLVQNTKLFVAAIAAGDLAKAKQLYTPAHANYERIEPVASSFKDLDARLDARENDLPADQWRGFHKLEKALWIDGTTSGLTSTTQDLVNDALLLHLSVQVVKLTPTDVVDGAVSLLGEASHTKITGEEDRYSHTDLYDLAANIEGSLAGFEVLRPFLIQKNVALVNDVEAKFQQIEALLKPLRTPDGFVDYTTLTNSDKRGIGQAIDAAGESLSKVAIQLPAQ